MVSNPLIWFLQNSRWPRGNAYIHIHHSQRIFTWGSKPFPLWHRLRQNAKWFWRFNLTGLVWLASKTSKNHNIKVKKDKVTSYQKKVKRCQKISTSEKNNKIWSKISQYKWPPSNGLERFKCHFFLCPWTVWNGSRGIELFRTISNYFAFGLFLPSNGLERLKCTVKASRKNICFLFFKSVLTVLS